MRRLSDRARLEGMLALRKALEGVRRTQNSAPQIDSESANARESVADRREPEDATWWRRAESTRDFPLGMGEGRHDALANDRPAASLDERDAELTKALDRVADSIERIAAQLDSYHQERAEHLDAIEFLLREMVISTVPQPAARSVVLGGVVDPNGADRGELEGDRGITIIPDGYPLEVDTAVEVRSRFHDRWISGFSIAEAVDTAGRCRYRLTRRSDGIPLPILFEACDVRAASNAFDRQPASARAPMRDSRIGS